MLHASHSPEVTKASQVHQNSHSGMRMPFLFYVRRLAWVAVLAAVIALAIIYVRGDRPFGWPTGTQVSHGTLQIGGPFTLTDQNGRRVSNTDFAGKPLAVFFGFTYCPDVCPTTLTDLTVIMEKIGNAADKVQVLFISVDHERDRPETLKSYMESFDPRFLALTGTADEIRDAAKAFRVHYKKVTQDGEDSYTMDHTATVFLLDSSHRFVGTIDFHEDRRIAVQKLERLSQR